MKSLLFFYFYISQFAASIECPRRSNLLSPRLDLFSLNRKLECGIGTNERQPWSVTLRMTDGVLCGGALISPNWVLTSADCAERFEEKWGSVFLERIENGLLLGPSRCSRTQTMWGARLPVGPVFVEPCCGDGDS